MIQARWFLPAPPWEQAKRVAGSALPRGVLRPSHWLRQREPSPESMAHFANAPGNETTDDGSDGFE